MLPNILSAECDSESDRLLIDLPESLGIKRYWYVA
uniref:Unclassified n=1 Tax=Fusarium clavum TaxID=2594811 RepID=W1ID09_9HYPO|nr:unclassified [Fusarium clavum]CEF82630.1 unclassified [Fusarium clavum]